MIFNRLAEKREMDINSWVTEYSEQNGYDPSPFEKELRESTYFSCLKVISESIAKCTLQVKKETDKGEFVAKEHYLYDLLRLRPNKYMSSVDVFKVFISSGKHYGVSGLYINRVGTRIEGLYPVKITGLIVDNAGLIKGSMKNKILWEYTSLNGEYGSAFDKDIILYKDFTLDGINTKPIRTIAKQSIDTSIQSQTYLNSLFINGLTNRIVVQLTSDIKEESELNKIQDKFSRIYRSNNKIFTVPAGFNVSPLNLSLSDAQFTELRKLSKEEIATLMQVPLSKLGIVRDTAISEEQDNIKFLSDCLQVIITSIEQELDYKLLTETERSKGYKIRFNVSTLLRLDSKTQADVINSYVRNGVYDLDFAKDILGVPRLGGDPIITLPSGQVLLRDLLAGNVSYMKGNKDKSDNVNEDDSKEKDGDKDSNTDTG